MLNSTVSTTNPTAATGGVVMEQHSPRPNPLSISSLIDGPLTRVVEEAVSDKTQSYSVEIKPATHSSTSSTSSSLSCTPAPSTPPSSSSNTDKEISCMNCKTTSTPLWRRDPSSGAHLCNRCGLYLKTYNVMHPLTKIKRRAINSTASSRKENKIVEPAALQNAEEMDDVEQMPRPANCQPEQLQQVDVRVIQRRRITPKQQISLGMTPRCFNCSAEQTPLWRRDPEDNIICNACGLYYKLHGKARPVSMKRAAVKRRNRTNVQPTSRVSVGPVSVPVTGEAADGGAVSAGPGDPSMGGLEFLMRAAELSPMQGHCEAKKSAVAPAATVIGGGGMGMLESLASVAAAAAAAGGPNKENNTEEQKEQLQMECQRLEQLLAQSKAMLSTLD